MNTKEFSEESVIDTIQDVNKLLIYNSSHFWDDVVSQLQKATGYDTIHCEQIAVIAHTTGKAVVKSGKIEELVRIDNVLCEINLVTEIE